jgi:membrane-associated phospholipid phosphatase
VRRNLGKLVLSAVLLLAVMAGLGWLDVHVLSHGSVGAADRSLDSSLAQHRDAFWNSVTKVLTFSAETMPVIVASFVVLVISALVFRRWHEPLFVAATLIGEVTIFVTTTLLVHRARPTVPHLDHAPPTSSFPSGHTAAAIALFGVIAALVIAYGAGRTWRTLAIALAVLMPLAVAMSRMYRGMHYLTDVIGGALLGGAWLYISTRFLLRAAIHRIGGATYPGSGPHERAVRRETGELPAARTPAVS